MKQLERLINFKYKPGTKVQYIQQIKFHYSCTPEDILFIYFSTENVYLCFHSKVYIQFSQKPLKSLSLFSFVLCFGYETLNYDRMMVLCIDKGRHMTKQYKGKLVRNHNCFPERSTKATLFI